MLPGSWSEERREATVQVRTVQGCAILQASSYGGGRLSVFCLCTAARDISFSSSPPRLSLPLPCLDLALLLLLFFAWFLELAFTQCASPPPLPQPALPAESLALLPQFGLPAQIRRCPATSTSCLSSCARASRRAHDTRRRCDPSAAASANRSTGSGGSSGGCSAGEACG